MFKLGLIMSFFLILNLIVKSLFRILMLHDNSFSFAKFRLQSLNFLVKISSFFTEFLVHWITLVLSAILKISIRFLEFLEILVLVLNLLLHHFIFLLDLSYDVLHISFDRSFFFFKAIVVILVVVGHFIDSVFVFFDLVLHLFVVETLGVVWSFLDLLLFIVIELFDLSKLCRRLCLVTWNEFIDLIFLFLELSFKISFSFF